jgi:hypothetical protein
MAQTSYFDLFYRMQKIWESQRKHIRAANKHERENREMHLIEKITEETKVRKARSRNRE